MHAKIVPEWLQSQRAPSSMTHVLFDEELPEEEEASSKPEADADESEDENAIKDKYGNVLKKSE